MARSLLTIVAFAALGLAAASQKENALRGRDGLNEAIRMANANAVAEPAVGEELDSTTTTGTGGGEDALLQEPITLPQHTRSSVE